MKMSKIKSDEKICEIVKRRSDEHGHDLAISPSKLDEFEYSEDFIFDTRENPWLTSKFRIMKNLMATGRSHFSANIIQ